MSSTGAIYFKFNIESINLNRCPPKSRYGSRHAWNSMNILEQFCFYCSFCTSCQDHSITAKNFKCLILSQWMVSGEIIFTKSVTKLLFKTLCSAKYVLFFWFLCIRLIFLLFIHSHSTNYFHTCTFLDMHWFYFGLCWLKRFRYFNAVWNVRFSVSNNFCYIFPSWISSTN